MKMWNEWAGQAENGGVSVDKFAVVYDERGCHFYFVSIFVFVFVFVFCVFCIHSCKFGEGVPRPPWSAASSSGVTTLSDPGRKNTQ